MIDKEELKEKKKEIKKYAHLNYMGDASYDIINPITNLRIAASSSFFGEGQYYNRDLNDERTPKVAPREGYLENNELDYLKETLNSIEPLEWRNKTPKQLMEFAIDDALSFDIESTLKVASDLRNIDNIRTTPIVILVRAANHGKSKGTNLVRKFGEDILQRGDEPVKVLQYQLENFGRPIPNSLKKICRSKLNSFDEYVLSKYRLEKSKFKTLDAVINALNTWGYEDSVTVNVNKNRSNKIKTSAASKS